MRGYYFTSFWLVFVTLGMSLMLNLWASTGVPSPIPIAAMYILMAALYLFVIYRFQNETSEKAVLILLVGALIARFIPVFQPAILSIEMRRFIWDGMIYSAGFNPYSYPPNSPALEPLRALWWNSLEFREYGSMYPPMAQYLFLIFAQSIVVWKLFLVGCEILSLYCLHHLLRLKELPPGRILLYAYLPLPIIEISHSGHLEGALSPFILGAFLLVMLSTKSNTKTQLQLLAAGALSACGALVHYLALLPGFALGAGIWKEDRRKGLLFTGGALVSLLLCAVPFLDASLSLRNSLWPYYVYHRFNDSLLFVFDGMFGTGWETVQNFYWINLSFSVLWLAFVCYLIARHRTRPVLVTAYAFCSYFLFSTSVQPWCGLFFAALLPLVSSRALIYLCLSLPLAHSQIIFAELLPLWLRGLEYLPAYYLLGQELYQLHRENNT